MSKTTKKSKFKINRNLSIGSPDAETDDSLLEVFVQTFNLEEIIDTTNQKSILIGRTGTGKSAIIKYLLTNCENIVAIEPEAMSLRFLSNSTILRYFKSLNVNLTLFYKVLWKHVFVVELLKLYYKDNLDPDKGKFKQLIQKVRDTTSKKNPSKERALEYLEKWSKDFWLQTEHRVKTLEKGLYDKFSSSIGAKFTNTSLGLSSENELSQKQTIEAKHKAEKVIHDSQSDEILQIVKIMKEDIFTNHQRKFFIVIDDLDREWIEDEYRYELIGAMVEVIKEFRKLIGVKIVISLRENLNEIVFSGIANKGGQREKFKPLYSKLTWSKKELLTLVDLRLKRLSDSQLDIKNAFYTIRKSKKTGIDYMIERTFNRPRDIISFINHTINNAYNKTVFSKDLIAKAEPSYSLDRFQALEDEWAENFGQLSGICHFLQGINNGFSLRTIKDASFEDIFVDEDNQGRLKGDLYRAVTDWRNEKITFHNFLKRVLFILYRIGIIGVKKESVFATAFFYDDEIPINKSDISNKCKFYVHPSLYSYFKVNTMEQLPEDHK